MALAIFTTIPALNYGAEDALPTLIQKFAGVGREQRAAMETIGRRRLVMTIQATSAERVVVDEFFRVANYQVAAWLMKDPDFSTRTAVSLGTSIASQVIFDLPATGENSRDYPVDDANFIVYDDGSPVSVASIDTDARQVTTSASPTAGSVMTGDYHYYRLWRLVGTFRWAKLAPDWYEAQIEVMEVPA